MADVTVEPLAAKHCYNSASLGSSSPSESGVWLTSNMPITISIEMSVVLSGKQTPLTAPSLTGLKRLSRLFWIS